MSSIIHQNVLPFTTFVTGSVNKLCDQYWPKKVGTSQTFDYIEVHNVDEEDFVAGQVVLRYLNLKSKFALEYGK